MSEAERLRRLAHCMDQLRASNGYYMDAAPSAADAIEAELRRLQDSSLTMLAALKYVQRELAHVDGPWKQIVDSAIEKAEPK